MGARDLLTELVGAGMTVAPEGDKLVVRPSSLLTDEWRNQLRAAKPELMALLRSAARSPATTDWLDGEIADFLVRRDRLMRWGHSEADAEALAERLLQRDRDGDDRRMCVECTSLTRASRCSVAAAGRMPGVDRRLEPVSTVLQRCEAFQPRKENA